VEELLDADLALEDLRLHPLLNIEFDVNDFSRLDDAESAQVRGVALCDL
jgi:hypothetical protein